MGPRRDRSTGSRTRRALSGVTALALAGCVPTAGDPIEVPGHPNDAVDGEIVRIIDGDSLVISIDGSDVDVRLAGINAPEADECHGGRSSEATNALATGSAEVAVVDTDQFGRSVALVWTESGFVNAALVETGNAIAMTAEDPWARTFIAAEESARSARLGIWAPDACGETITAELRIEISEPDPPGPDNDVLAEELVTVTNEGATEVDLSGFVLRDESSVNRLRLPNGTRLGPGQTIEISSGCPSAPALGWCSRNAIWNNGGDSSLLLGPAGTIVAHVRYDPSR